MFYYFQAVLLQNLHSSIFQRFMGSYQYSLRFHLCSCIYFTILLIYVGLFCFSLFLIVQKGMLLFDTAQFDGILKKIAEFNATLASDPVNLSKQCIIYLELLTFCFYWYHCYMYDHLFNCLDQDQKALALSESEFSKLGAIVKVLKDTSHYHSSTISDADMSLLVRLLKSWPPQMMFPGINYSLHFCSF